LRKQLIQQQEQEYFTISAAHLAPAQVMVFTCQLATE
jgi:hypothetical protein